VQQANLLKAGVWQAKPAVMLKQTGDTQATKQWVAERFYDLPTTPKKNPERHLSSCYEYQSNTEEQT
jgi:hypothetical protein